MNSDVMNSINFAEKIYQLHTRSEDSFLTHDIKYLYANITIQLLKENHLDIEII